MALPGAGGSGDSIRNGTILDVVRTGRYDGSLTANRRDTGATVTLKRDYVDLGGAGCRTATALRIVQAVAYDLEVLEGVAEDRVRDPVEFQLLVGALILGSIKPAPLFGDLVGVLVN